MRNDYFRFEHSGEIALVKAIFSRSAWRVLCDELKAGLCRLSVRPLDAEIETSVTADGLSVRRE
jgi:hypothetical protein